MVFTIIIYLFEIKHVFDSFSIKLKSLCYQI